MVDPAPVPDPNAPPTAGEIVLQKVLDAAKPQLTALLMAARDNFMAEFGNWVQTSHRDRLEELFLTAGEAKLAVLTARTQAQAQEQQDIYLTTIASIETLGLAVWIVSKAEAVAALKATIHQIVSTVAVVAGAIVKFVIEEFVPIGGPVLGPLGGAGVTFLINELFGPKS